MSVLRRWTGSVWEDVTNYGVAVPTAGGVAYGTGTVEAYTAAGTTNQVLLSQGASPPVWDGNAGQIMAVPVSSASNSTVTVGTTETRDAVFGNYVFTAVASHRYQVFLNSVTLLANTAGDRFWCFVRNGGSSTPTSSSTLLAQALIVIPATWGNSAQLIGSFAPGAGTQTLSVFLVRNFGTGTAYIGSGREMYVIDLGVSA